MRITYFSLRVFSLISHDIKIKISCSKIVIFISYEDFIARLRKNYTQGGIIIVPINNVIINDSNLLKIK